MLSVLSAVKAHDLMITDEWSFYIKQTHEFPFTREGIEGERIAL